MTNLTHLQDLPEATGSDRFTYRGSECSLSFQRGSDILLVTFDNLATIDDRPTNGPWDPWLASRAHDLGFSILGVQSHHKNWYRTSEAPALIRKLVEAKFFQQFTRVLFVGASMGGFAALCFAPLVPGARVLAFSPQSTLNRNIAPFERRYPWPYRKFDWDTPEFLDAASQSNGPVQGHVLYDPHVIEDKRHAQRLQLAGAEAVPLPFADHTLIRTVIKCGALHHLLQRLTLHDKVDTQFWRLMRNRRKDEGWAKRLMKHLAARGDGALLQRAGKELYEKHGYRFAYRIAKKRKEEAAVLQKNIRVRRETYPSWTDALTEHEIRQRIPTFVWGASDEKDIKEVTEWCARHGFANVVLLKPQSHSASHKENSSASSIAITEVDGILDPVIFASRLSQSSNGFLFMDTNCILPQPPASDLMTKLIDLATLYGFAKAGLGFCYDPAVVNLDYQLDSGQSVEQQQKQIKKQILERDVYQAPINRSFCLFFPTSEQSVDSLPHDHAQLPAICVARAGFLATPKAWRH